MCVEGVYLMQLRLLTIFHFHILLYRIVAVFGLSASLTFGFHSFGIGVINIGFAIFDQFFTVVQNGLEMVRSTGEVIVFDPKQFQIL